VDAAAAVAAAAASRPLKLDLCRLELLLLLSDIAIYYLEVIRDA